MSYTHPKGDPMPEKLKRPPSTMAPSTHISTKASLLSAATLAKREEKALQEQHNISLQAKFDEATADTR
jgi:hypothetical protein